MEAVTQGRSWEARKGTCAGLLAVIALVAGCGESGPVKYEVTGKIFYQGKPLPTGNVMFIPEQGPASATAIRPDGSYTLKAMPGKHRVGVTAVPVVELPPGAAEWEYNPPPPLVPARFGRPETSGVTVVVEPVDRNTIDITLE